MKVRNIRNCSRCGGDHDEVEAKKMERPHAPSEAHPLVWTHWAACPTSGDPILIMVTP